MNRLLPDVAAGGYFKSWRKREAEELDAIERSFPVPIRRASLQAREVLGVEALTRFGRELFDGVDPVERLHSGRPLRIRRAGGRTRLEIDLPGIAKEEIEVLVRGADLHLRVRDGRRSIHLPDSLVGRTVERVRLREPTLEISFSDG